MISVKGLRSGPANPANPDRHELKEELSAYRLPALIGLMLASLMLYLRSFLPVNASTAGDQGPPNKPFADPDDKVGSGPIDAAAATDGNPWNEGTQGHHTPDINAAGDTETGPSVLRSRSYGAQQDANVLKPNELTAISAVVRPANTNTPDMPRDSFQNFPPPYVGASAGSRGGGGTGGGIGNGDSGGSGGNGGGNGGPDTDDDDDDDITPPLRTNRAPRNSGSVYLADVASTATLAIVLSQLLSHSTDEDGDTLSVRNLRASSGTVTELPDGSWLFTPSLTNFGRVVFSFEVWDGLVAVPQWAYSMVTGSPVDTGGGDDTGTGGHDDDDVCEGGGAGVTGYNPVIGGLADDVLIGTDGNDLMKGNAGNDFVYGGLGDDLMYGGDGRDHMSGGGGDDQLFGDADDDILFGDNGNDALDGGTGSDVLFGGAGDDALFGSGGDDVLSGDDGDDQMSGGAGTDEMLGGAGHDIMFGDAGADLMLGGEGRDVLFGGADADALYGDDGDDLLAGGDGDDVAHDGAGIDLVDLGAGDDRMVVAIDLDADQFIGGDGQDTLDYAEATESIAFNLAAAVVTMGDAEGDRISGFESYVGGHGDDTFIACDTSAILTGGEGDDRFQFLAGSNPANAVETMFQITDFSVGDRVSVSRYDFFKDLADDLEDQMEDYFDQDGHSGRGSDEPSIRFRYDRDDRDGENTRIEIDFDRDDFYETTISMQGHHLFVVVETV